VISTDQRLPSANWASLASCFLLHIRTREEWNEGRELRVVVVRW
jgi:hypothetical protein